MSIDASRILLSTGIILLSIAALTGFMQARAPSGSEAHVRWRVAHAGGTAGGVQLVALAAVWESLGGGRFPAAALLALGLCASAAAFFVGPTLRALGAERPARWVNLVGALIATPSYVVLPLLTLS